MLLMRIGQVVALLALGLLFWFGLRPEPIPNFIAHSDKWSHLIGFAAVSLALFVALPNWPKGFTVIVMLACGLLVELGQELFLPRRMFDVEDLLVNAAGIGIALLVFGLLSTIIRWFSYKKGSA